MANLLIVELAAAHSDILRKILSFRGHGIVTAASSEEALAKIQCHRPDLITINPMLPDRNGFDFCNSLKSRRHTCLIPVVVITSLHDERYRELSFRSGSNVHLVMPYSMEQLFTAVEEALCWTEDDAARCGMCEIVIDTRHEGDRLRQTNDLIVDVLRLMSLPEDDVRELKRIVLEMGDRLRDWGFQKQCERVASIQSKVERDRINLAICRDGLPVGTHDDPLSMSLDALVERFRFTELPGSRTEGRVVLNRSIRL
jgi:DNA-binding response OmpR family regulator